MARASQTVIQHQIMVNVVYPHRIMCMETDRAIHRQRRIKFTGNLVCHSMKPENYQLIWWGVLQFPYLFYLGISTWNIITRILRL